MFQDVDNAWSFDHFARNFAVNFNSAANDGNDIEFDVEGVDPAIMNAIRRIVISEVSMAVAVQPQIAHMRPVGSAMPKLCDE